MSKHFKFHDELLNVQPGGPENPLKASINERQMELSLTRISENEYLAVKDGKQSRLFVARGKDGSIFISSNGRSYKLVPAEDGVEGLEAESAAHSGKLIASMPGRIIKILAENGQAVEKDQAVFIMESMKMEITQISPFKGRVVEINAKPGQLVDAGAVIVRLEPDQEKE